MNQNLRQLIHDHMAQTAARHAATGYPGIMDGDTAAQLFALLTDTALAYLIKPKPNSPTRAPASPWPLLPACPRRRPC